MTPFERGVRAGLAAAARVADELVSEWEAAAAKSTVQWVKERADARAEAIEQCAGTIRSLDPATVKETGDGRE